MNRYEKLLDVNGGGTEAWLAWVFDREYDQPLKGGVVFDTLGFMPLVALYRVTGVEVEPRLKGFTGERVYFRALVEGSATPAAYLVAEKYRRGWTVRNLDDNIRLAYSAEEIVKWCRSTFARTYAWEYVDAACDILGSRLAILGIFKKARPRRKSRADQD